MSVEEDGPGNYYIMPGLEGVNFAATLSRMLLDARAQGFNIGIDNGFRTYAEQQALVDELGLYPNANGTGAAAPGTSNHEFGNAVDLALGAKGSQTRANNIGWLAANAGNYGLGFPVPNEPWHVEVSDVSLAQSFGPVGSNTNSGGPMAGEGSTSSYGLPAGYTAYVSGGQQFVRYEVIPGSGVWLSFQHSGAVSGTVMTEAQNNSAMSEANVVEAGSSGSLLTDPLLSGQNWNAIVDRFLFAAGISGTDAMNDPGIIAVMAEYIARPDMTPQELANRLEATDYWNQHTDQERLWNDLSEAEQTTMALEQVMTLVRLWNQYTGEGIAYADMDVDGDGHVTVAEVQQSNRVMWQWARGIVGGTRTEMQAVAEWITPAAAGMENSPHNRLLMEEEQAQNNQAYQENLIGGQIVDVMDRWGVEASDEDIAGWANAIFMQEDTMEDIEGRAQEISAATWAHKPEDVDFQTWSQQYAASYSQLLEIPNPTFRDTDFAGMLQTADTPNISDFRRQVMETDAWQATNNARDKHTNVKSQVAQLMGFA